MRIETAFQAQIRRSSRAARRIEDLAFTVNAFGLAFAGRIARTIAGGAIGHRGHATLVVTKRSSGAHGVGARGHGARLSGLGKIDGNACTGARIAPEAGGQIAADIDVIAGIAQFARLFRAHIHGRAAKACFTLSAAGTSAVQGHGCLAGAIADQAELALIGIAHAGIAER